MYNVLGKFPLFLHAVSQRGGRESLPSQGFQLEISNDKQVLDLPSIPQNLNPNYTKKTKQGQQGKFPPAEAMSKQASHGNADKELREAQTWASEGGWYSCRSLNGIFWNVQILASYWMKMLDLFVYLLQGYKCVYISISHLCKENFENINQRKLCKRNNSSIIVFFHPQFL